MLQGLVSPGRGTRRAGPGTWPGSPHRVRPDSEESIELALPEEAQGGRVIRDTLAVHEVHIDEIDDISVLDHRGVQEAPLSKLLISKISKVFFWSSCSYGTG